MQILAWSLCLRTNKTMPPTQQAAPSGHSDIDHPSDQAKLWQHRPTNFQESIPLMHHALSHGQGIDKVNTYASVAIAGGHSEPGT